MHKVIDIVLCNGCHTCYSIFTQEYFDMVENIIMI